MKTRNLPAIFTALSIGTARLEPASAQTWVQTSAPSNNWASIALSADGTRIVAVAGGSHAGPIYTSTDYGVTWVSNSVTPEIWADVASSADGTKLVAVAGGVYTNSGTTWALAFSPGSPGNQQFADAVASSANGSKLVIADNLLFTPLIYTSTNSGATWLSVTSSPNAGWTAVASSADGNYLVAARAAGFAGSIYTSTNAGALWVSNNAPSFPWNSLASSANGSNLLATASPFLVASTNAGAVWAPVLNQPGAIYKIACSTNGNIWFAISTNTGQIYSSFNSGANWIANTAPLTNWSAIAVSADGLRGAAASDSGGIYILQPPLLTITSATNSVSLFWATNDALLGLGLEQNTNLATTSWQAVTTVPTVTNIYFRVTLPATNSQLFFRLASP